MPCRSFFWKLEGRTVKQVCQWVCDAGRCNQTPSPTNRAQHAPHAHQRTTRAFLHPYELVKQAQPISRTSIRLGYELRHVLLSYYMHASTVPTSNSAATPLPSRQYSFDFPVSSLQKRLAWPEEECHQYAANDNGHSGGHPSKQAAHRLRLVRLYLPPPTPWYRHISFNAHNISLLVMILSLRKWWIPFLVLTQS